MKELNLKKVSFSEGLQHGDRFPYHVNYVERTPDFVASHFGQSMADNVFSIPVSSSSPDSQQWKGPFESPYGYHLVMISRREAGRYPALADVVGQVHQDAQRKQIRQNLDKTYQAIIDTYQVELSEELTRKTEKNRLSSSLTSEAGLSKES